MRSSICGKNTMGMKQQYEANWSEASSTQQKFNNHLTQISHLNTAIQIRKMHANAPNACVQTFMLSESHKEKVREFE
jgi:hypothetical protein